MKSTGERKVLTQQRSGATRSRRMQELLQVLDRLAEIAQSDLPQSAKLELLCTQIGTARFWADQVSGGTEAASLTPTLYGPHIRPTSRVAASMERPVRQQSKE